MPRTKIYVFVCLQKNDTRYYLHIFSKDPDWFDEIISASVDQINSRI